MALSGHHILQSKLLWMGFECLRLGIITYDKNSDDNLSLSSSLWQTNPLNVLFSWPDPPKGWLISVLGLPNSLMLQIIISYDLLLNWFLSITNKDISVIYLRTYRCAGRLKCCWIGCFMSQSTIFQLSILFFRSPQKIQNLVEDIEILLPGKFRWILFRGFRGEVENVVANQRPGSHFVFPILPKNTNLVEDVKILAPVKFRWIPFSRFREEVENVKS